MLVTYTENHESLPCRPASGDLPSPPMDEMRDLESLASALGVDTSFVDGLGNHVQVAPETLVHVCRTLGAPIARPADAAAALLAVETARASVRVPPVIVAWNGLLPELPLPDHGGAMLHMEDGTSRTVPESRDEKEALPIGYHRLEIDTREGLERATIISAPERTWRRPNAGRRWGIAAQLGALRSSRSRSLGDLRDLEQVCEWIRDLGGDVVMLLPLLPTFNTAPAEPSPYSPVSRLFWSELALDLGGATRPTPAPSRLDVTEADREVRLALADMPSPDPESLSSELRRYARFRGAQRRLGRDWRTWPVGPQTGNLGPEHVDADEERFHLVAQTLAQGQLERLRDRLRGSGVRLGLDLAVGVHPEGYDAWSRQRLFADEMSVGAPPDVGFPSGQDWAIAPLLPAESRRTGHRYLAEAISHQASVSGLLRIDHIMALHRLYWIPHGFDKHAGTYVRYPQDELFAVLSVESHRRRCEITGENLGTVPPAIDAAMQRHDVEGMYLAQFAAWGSDLNPPGPDVVGFLGTHDTATFEGWTAGRDIEERIEYGLLAEDSAPAARDERAAAVRRLAEHVGADVHDLPGFLEAALAWLGVSESPVVIAWLEDLWLEPDAVNLPGTRSSERPNWQRPMKRLLEEITGDPAIHARIRRLDEARRSG